MLCVSDWSLHQAQALEYGLRPTLWLRTHNSTITIDILLYVRSHNVGRRPYSSTCDTKAPKINKNSEEITRHSWTSCEKVSAERRHSLLTRIHCREQASHVEHVISEITRSNRGQTYKQRPTYHKRMHNYEPRYMSINNTWSMGLSTIQT